MANQDGNESYRLFVLGMFFVLFSPLGVLAAVYLLTSDGFGRVAVLLSGVFYLCGLALLIRSRPSAARQSQRGRRKFIFGIALLIIAPLGLLATACCVGMAAFGAGLGDAPATSFWSSPFIMKASMAALVPSVLFACGLHQLIQSRRCPPP
jgi:nitrate reductase gamma subunit